MIRDFISGAAQGLKDPVPAKINYMKCPACSAQEKDGDVKHGMKKYDDGKEEHFYSCKKCGLRFAVDTSLMFNTPKGWTTGAPLGNPEDIVKFTVATEPAQPDVVQPGQKKAPEPSPVQAPAGPRTCGMCETFEPLKFEGKGGALKDDPQNGYCPRCRKVVQKTTECLVKE